MKLLANEFILPFVDGWSCHASHFVVLRDGRVFCVFFYGSAEGKGDVRIFGSFRNPDGSWSEAFAISEDDGIAHWNPVLMERPDGGYTLFYKIGRTIPEWKTFCRVSHDDCRTWSDPFEMIPGDVSGGRGPVRNKTIYLSDGSILAPGSTEVGEWKCFFDRSTDGGETWVRSEDVSIAEELRGKYSDLNRRGIIQPTLWESADGVHALMRSTEGRIYRTDSADFTNWCTPYAIDMPNNNSGIDLAQLPDGRLILACNPNGENWGSRTPLSLYVSHDNGLSFSLYSHLITMPGAYAYPAIRYADGCLHVTYTWNRKTIAYMCLGDL